LAPDRWEILLDSARKRLAPRLAHATTKKEWITEAQ
jgi:hypothetical protein